MRVFQLYILNSNYQYNCSSQYTLMKGSQTDKTAWNQQQHHRDNQKQKKNANQKSKPKQIKQNKNGMVATVNEKNKQQAQQHKVAKQLNNGNMVTAQEDKNNQKISSKSLKNQFDKVESRLQNRDLSVQQLKSMVSLQFLSKLVKGYHQFQSLQQQVCRIILQIYSHYPIRNVLYKKYKESNRNSDIESIIVPLLLNTHRFVNQSAAIECIRGFVSQGGLSVLHIFASPVFFNLQSNNSQLIQQISKNQNKIIGFNIEIIVKKLFENPKNQFMCGIFQIILEQLRICYNKIGIQMEISINIQIRKSLQADNSLTKCRQILKSLVILITKYTKLLGGPIKQAPKLTDILFNIIKLYIDEESHSIQIPSIKSTIGKGKNNGNMENINQQCLLIYQWACHRICDNFVTQEKGKSKIKTYPNYAKQVFAKVMLYLQSLTVKKYVQRGKSDSNQSKQNNNDVKKMIKLLICLFYPFSLYQPASSMETVPNTMLILVLTKYSDLFIYLLTTFNIEYLIEQKYLQTVFNWLFQLAVYCDEIKSRHKLEELLNRVSKINVIKSRDSLRISGRQQEILQSPEFEETEQINYGFQYCQSLLYRILISVEKCLPSYPLKYYDYLYIEKPGIFHLYFINQLLTQRSPPQITKFLVQLIQRWIQVEMRDFNVLGYICKFMKYFLSSSIENKAYSEEERLLTLFNFFRALSPEAIVHLNTVFYESSFPDSNPSNFNYIQNQQTQMIQGKKLFNENSNTAPVSNVSSVNLNSNSVSLVNNIRFMQSNKQIPYESLPRPSFNFTLPPLTLNIFEQQSQFKSCGYSYNEKTVYIDRNYFIPEQLLKWSTLLHEINDDQFYYHCKYFYYLLSSAFKHTFYPAQQPKSKRRSSVSKKGIQAVQSQLGKLNKIIEIWQNSIIKNKTSQVQSIFQILLCWSVSFTGEQCDHFLSKIIKIILEHSQKILNVPLIHSQNWKQALKQLQMNSQLFENYKKQQNKIKNKQLYFLRSIVRFFQNNANRLFYLIPKSITFETVVEILQLFSQYAGGATCCRSVRILSEKTGRNIFVEQASKIISDCGCYGNSRQVRRKLEVYRQLLFAYIEQSQTKAKPPQIDTHTGPESQNDKNSQNSYNSLNSQQRSIKYISEIELKVTMTEIISECIEIISSVVIFNHEKPLNNLNLNMNMNEKNTVKNQKEEMYNKMLAVQIMEQFFSHVFVNRKCLQLLHGIVVKHADSKQKQKKRGQSLFMLQKLKLSLIKILFRSSKLTTKYQRKLILFLRLKCLNLAASNYTLLFDEYFKMKGGRPSINKQQQHKIINNSSSIFITKLQVSSILWHLALDEEIEIRIQVLSIINNSYKSDRFQIIQSSLYLVCSILTVMHALQPKYRIKMYVQAIAKQIQAIIGSACNYDFILNLTITIGFLIFNSRVNIPVYDIFDSFCSLWMKNQNVHNNNQRDCYYLLFNAIQTIQNQGYKFSYLSLSQHGNKSENITQDFKLYYMNAKSRKKWLTSQDNQQTEFAEYERTYSILKWLKQIITQKNCNAKFLKSKKLAILDMNQLLKQEGIGCMLKKLDERQLKYRKQKQTKLRLNTQDSRSVREWDDEKEERNGNGDEYDFDI